MFLAPHTLCDFLRLELTNGCGVTEREEEASRKFDKDDDDNDVEVGAACWSAAVAVRVTSLG